VLLLLLLGPVLNGSGVSVCVGLVLHAVLSDGDDTFASNLMARVSAENGLVVDHLSVFAERLEAMLDEGCADLGGDLFGVEGLSVDFDDFQQSSAGAFEVLNVADFNFHG